MFPVGLEHQLWKVIHSVAVMCGFCTAQLIFEEAGLRMYGCNIKDLAALYSYQVKDNS